MLVVICPITCFTPYYCTYCSSTHCWYPADQTDTSPWFIHVHIYSVVSRTSPQMWGVRPGQRHCAHTPGPGNTYSRTWSNTPVPWDWTGGTWSLSRWASGPRHCILSTLQVLWHALLDNPQVQGTGHQVLEYAFFTGPEDWLPVLSSCSTCCTTMCYYVLS